MAIEFDISQNDYEKVNELSPLPAGEYKVVIESCIVTRTKNSGKDMLKITMKVIGGNCINRKIFDYIVDNEYLKDKVMRILKATNVKVSRFIPNVIVNKNCIVELELNEQGKNNVAKYKKMPVVTDEIPMGNATIDPNLAPPLSDEPPF